MAELTPQAQRASEQINVQPNLVFSIDGYPIKFGTQTIRRYVKIGDFKIGDGTKIGGLIEMENQKKYLMMSGGATTSFTQAIAPDRGQGSGVAQMTVVLIDKNEEISKLISPGQELEDILGRRCTLELGMSDVDYPNSYSVLMRGFVQDIKASAGNITLKINQAEDQKARTIKARANATLNTAMDLVSPSTINVSDSNLFLTSVSGPEGVDTSLTFYARIGDEIIGYTSSFANNLGGVTRGQLGTVVEEHDVGDEVYPIYRLNGLAMDIALKLMLSGEPGTYATDVPIGNFCKVSPTESYSNAIFFRGISIGRQYGVVPGTFISTSGSPNGANNVSNKLVTDVVVTTTGSYILVDDVSFVVEVDSVAVSAYESRYNSFGEFGLKINQADVDVLMHELIRDRYLGSHIFDWWGDSIEQAKTFLDKLYKQAGCFSVTRNGSISVVYHSPPLPSEAVPVLKKTNILDPGNISVMRSLSSNFANNIIYKWDWDPVANEFRSVKDFPSSESQGRIKTGVKSMIIEALGLRTLSGAENSASLVSARLLARYEFGAEYFEQMKVSFGVGYALEIGQIVLMDTLGLNITNFLKGDRSRKQSLYEVQSITKNVSTAEIMVNLVNTAFGLDERFATFAPASIVEPGSTTSTIKIQRSYGTRPYEIEGAKWRNYVGLKIRVHSSDFTFDEEVTLQSVYEGDNSFMTVTPALSLAPGAGYIVDPCQYPSSSDPEDQKIWKLLHPFFSPNPLVATGISNLQFTVAPGDVSKFKVGFPITIHNDDFSVLSPERIITDVTGVTVTVNLSLGFTPSAGQLTDLLGFPDGGQCYRFI